MNYKEKKAYQEWLTYCDQVRASTPITDKVRNETASAKAARLRKLNSDPVAFAKWYFPHYIDSEFAWFHKKIFRQVDADPNIFGIFELPREHAKSVLVNVMIPMRLYAMGELTGMVVASQNESKAKTLLSDIQAEFQHNQRWINDYGELARMGDWRDGAFSTTDGMGFWAFGRGQSPRGIRKAALRPNYAVIDDIDDKVIVRNQKRVREIVTWILEDLYGALSIKGSRLVVAGNRIHKHSILAHLVGDLEHGDPKREGIVHIKVYAIEHPKTHKKADAHNGGVPAWKRYTIDMLTQKMKKMGYISARREYFHEHHEEDFIFKRKWIQFVKPLPINRYDNIIVYCDPSFKSTDKSDYKAIIAVGRKGKYLDILSTWVRQATTSAMVNHFYDLYDDLESHARYYMEANFLQDLILDEFEEVGVERDYQLPIRADKRKKPNKEVRIENLTPLFERGIIRISEKIRKSPDFETFKTQLLGFPFGKDDAPDALEGAVYFLQRGGRKGKFKARMGKYRTSNSRKL